MQSQSVLAAAAAARRSRLPLVAWLCAAVWLFGCLQGALSVPYKYPTLLVPVIMPYSVLPLAQVQAVLQLAQADIVQSGILATPYNPNNLSLELYYADSGNSPITAAAALLSIVSNVSLVGPTPIAAVIGELGTDASCGLAVTASGLNYVSLVPFSTSATLSDKTNYASSMRLSTVISYTAAAVSALLEQYDWSLFAVIFSDDDDGRGLLSYLVSSPIPNATMTVYSIPTNIVDQSVAAHFIQKTLTAIQSYGTRIIILHGSQSLAVLQAAEQYGLLGPPLVWIGTGWCNSTSLSLLQSSLLSMDSLTGVICAAPLLSSDLSIAPNGQPSDGVAPLSRSWSSFSSAVSSSVPAIFPTAADVGIDNGYLYDSLWVLALGLHGLSNSSANTSSVWNLWTVMQYEEFYGVTGRITFPPPVTGTQTGDRFADVAILNYDAVSQAFLTVGFFDPNSTSGLIAMRPDVRAVVWSDGTSNVPKDRPRVYVEGDTLPTSYSYRVIVLAYVMGVFGAWTCLLLVEQAISCRRQQYNLTAQAAVGHSEGAAKLLSQKGRRVRLDLTAVWVGWLVLAAIALGGCSIWMVQTVSFGSLVLDTVDTSFIPAQLFGALVLSCCLCFVALLIRISSYDVIKGADKVRSSLVDSRNSNEETTLNQRSVLLSAKQRDSNTSSSGQEHSSGSASNSDSSATDGQGRSKDGKLSGRERLRVTLLQTSKRMLLDWRALSCGVLVALAESLTHVLVGRSLAGRFDDGVSTGPLVSSGVLTLAVGLVPLWMIFFWHRSEFRFVASFILSAVLLSSYFVAMPAHTYSYQPATAAPDSAFAAGSLETLVLLAVLSSIACLGLILINVLALRRAREVLNVALSQAQQKQARLLEMAGQEQAEEAALAERVLLVRQTLETITYCRPLVRVHAVAITLAAVDKTALAASQTHTAGKGKANAELMAQLVGSDQWEPSRGSSAQRQPAAAISMGVSASLRASSNGNTNSPKDAGASAIAPTASPTARAAQAILTLAQSETEVADSVADADSMSCSGSGGLSAEAAHRKSTTSSGTKAYKGPLTVLSSSDPKSVGTSSRSGRGLAEGRSSSPNLDFDFAFIRSAKQPAAVLRLLRDCQVFFGRPGSEFAQLLSPAVLPFDALLLDLVGLELLKDAMAKHFTPENLAIWVDIQRYKQLTEPSLQQLVAGQMVALYISDGSAYEVNVSSRVKQSIASKVRERRLGGGLWEEVEREIGRLIVSNHWDHFIASPAYKLAVLALVHRRALLQRSEQLDGGLSTFMATLQTNHTHWEAPSTPSRASIQQQQPHAVTYSVDSPSLTRGSGLQRDSSASISRSPHFAARQQGSTWLSSRANTMTTSALLQPTSQHQLEGRAEGDGQDSPTLTALHEPAEAAELAIEQDDTLALPPSVVAEEEPAKHEKEEEETGDAADQLPGLVVEQEQQSEMEASAAAALVVASPIAALPVLVPAAAQSSALAAVSPLRQPDQANGERVAEEEWGGTDMDAV